MTPKLTTPSTILNDLLSVMMGEIERITPQDPSRRIIIYGAGARGAVIKAGMKSLGRQVAYFIDSDTTKQNTSVFGVPVHNPSKIKSENLDDVFVIVAADFPTEMVKTLESYGLEYGTHASCLFDRISINEGTPHTAPAPLLDFALGFNRMSDIPGFKCLNDRPTCNNGADLLRIVVLGNSTTDPEVIDPLIWSNMNLRDEGWGSWPRYLHALLNSNAVDNIIFNGAMSAYTSAQEVMKLLRDGLTLSPDMVIAFDGINDTGSTYWHENKYAKAHSHFNKVDKEIKPLLTSKCINIPTIESTSSIEGFCYGLESNHSALEEWHINQRIMKSICEEFDIEFVTFLQPGGLYLNSYVQSCDIYIRVHWLISYLFIIWRHLAESYQCDHQGIMLADLELRDLLEYYLSFVLGYDAANNNCDKGKDNQLEHFYREARRIASTSNHIVDIVDTLNGHPDVFYDACHCTAKGNRLIAQRVYQEISDNGLLNRALRKVAARHNNRDTVYTLPEKALFAVAS